MPVARTAKRWLAANIGIREDDAAARGVYVNNFVFVPQAIDQRGPRVKQLTVAAPIVTSGRFAVSQGHESRQSRKET